MYPIYHISINKLHYFVEHPHFWGSSKSNQEYITRQNLFLEQLKSQGFVSLVTGAHPNEIETIKANINNVWKGFKQHRAMVNPLIVKKHKNKYYVIIGNQRLTCLRALNFENRVPCRIAKSDDHWDDHCEPLKMHPYDPV